MPKNIHPPYFPEAKISCACGNSFTVGASVPEMRLEICSACHPLFTGKLKLVDTARRVDRFQSRLEKTKIKQGQKNA